MKRPSLHWRIVSVLLAVSLMPVCLLGIGVWVVFGRLFETKAFELQLTTVEKHAQAIESYLEERVHLLELLAALHTLDNISDQQVLGDLFAGLNRVSQNGFVDLGVIDPEGAHRAYVGPYDLGDRNYKGTNWFDEVMTSGVHVSDVFLGFRQVPHCIIAVKAQSHSATWILRATINSEQFDRIVRIGVPGTESDAFILNREGCYQNTPRIGSVLAKAPIPAIESHQGVRTHRLEMDGRSRIQVTTWLNQNRWVLVVQQDTAEIRAPVRTAMVSGGFLMLVCVILVGATTFLATGHLNKQIDQAHAEREEIFRAFMRSAKLASVGELATGLAHEINNPLAIISAEDVNISDIVQEMDTHVKGREELLDSAKRINQQVARCGSITAKMLQFGRKGESALETIDMGPHLREIVELLQRQAIVRNVNMSLDIQNGLPRVLADPLELEQVLVNLINNSFYALPAGGHIRIIARHVDQEVLLVVRDNGSGIPPDDLDRIFEPFFTTKPVGQGTGLGLSVCYGIVHTWGASIEVESEPGCGTTMRIRFPQPDRNHPEPL